MVADLAKLSLGREDYYLREIAENCEEYLSGHGESPGRWYESAAAGLGQEGLASSRDAAGLQDMMLDPRWTSEGLFAFVEGLRRLAELDTASRVTVPELDAEA